MQLASLSLSINGEGLRDVATPSSDSDTWLAYRQRCCIMMWGGSSLWSRWAGPALGYTASVLWSWSLLLYLSLTFHTPDWFRQHLTDLFKQRALKQRSYHFCPSVWMWGVRRQLGRHWWSLISWTWRQGFNSYRAAGDILLITSALHWRKYDFLRNEHGD